MNQSSSLWPLVALFVGSFGCTNEANLGDRDAAASNQGDGGGAPSTQGTVSSVHGTLGGSAFVPTSGYGFYDANASTTCTGSDCQQAPSIALIFSSEANACAGALAGKVAPGATYVQVYNVGTTPGDFTSTDAKAAVIAPTCASGSRLSVSFSVDQGHAGPAKITLTKADGSVVEGTVSINFSDGSSFEGSFSLPMCSASLSEKSVCQ
jgi:hypothetical protein